MRGREFWELRDTCNRWLSSCSRYRFKVSASGIFIHSRNGHILHGMLGKAGLDCQDVINEGYQLFHWLEIMEMDVLKQQH